MEAEAVQRIRDLYTDLNGVEAAEGSICRVIIPCSILQLRSVAGLQTMAEWPGHEYADPSEALS